MAAAAAYLHVCQSTVRKYVTDGKLVPTVVHPNRRMEFSREALDACREVIRAYIRRDSEAIGANVIARQKQRQDQARALIPAGFLASGDVQRRFNVNHSKVALLAQKGHVRRERFGTIWGYEEQSLIAYTSARAAEEARKEVRRQPRQTPPTYGFWDTFLQERRGLKAIITDAQTVARDQKREVRITERRRWNGRVIEKLVCVIDAQGMVVA